MTQCAKCVAISQTPKVKEAGAHLVAMDGKPTRTRLDYAPPGKVRGDVTILTMFCCPEHVCNNRWWSGVTKDGSFVEWQNASENRNPLNSIMAAVSNRGSGPENLLPWAARHQVEKPVVEFTKHIPDSLGITRAL